MNILFYVFYVLIKQTCHEHVSHNNNLALQQCKLTEHRLRNLLKWGLLIDSVPGEATKCSIPRSRWLDQMHFLGNKTFRNLKRGLVPY